MVLQAKPAVPRSPKTFIMLRWKTHSYLICTMCEAREDSCICSITTASDNFPQHGKRYINIKVEKIITTIACTEEAGKAATEGYDFH